MRLVETLRWPVVALVATGMTHLVAEALRPDLRNDFTPGTIGPILLVYGLWVGYAMASRGATFGAAIAAGAAVGLLPLALDVVGFGILLGRGIDPGATAGVFGFLVVVFGTLAGAGFAVSRREELGAQAPIR